MTSDAYAFWNSEIYIAMAVVDREDHRPQWGFMLRQNGGQVRSQEKRLPVLEYGLNSDLSSHVTSCDLA